VKTQFGAGYGRMDHFKNNFRPILRLALAVYPDARVEEDEDGSGLILYPSKPPVPSRSIGFTAKLSQ
jgi:hypothetical protein